MVVGREGKPEMARHHLKSTKTGDFNLWKTFLGSFFIIPEHLVSIRVVVLGFTANNQNSQL